MSEKKDLKMQDFLEKEFDFPKGKPGSPFKTRHPSPFNTIDWTKISKADAEKLAANENFGFLVKKEDASKTPAATTPPKGEQGGGPKS